MDIRQLIDEGIGQAKAALMGFEVLREQGPVKPEANTWFETANGSLVLCMEKSQPGYDPWDDNEKPKWDKNDPPFYRCLVVKGGHKTRPDGENPGETYLVNLDGLFTNPQPEGERETKRFPAVIGMSLVFKLDVQFHRQERK
jgi:hypothetical protein